MNTASMIPAQTIGWQSRSAFLARSTTIHSASNFTLTKTDLEQVDQCRGPANKLGFAIQLCTLRWHGYFLPDTRGVPSSVVEMIGSQLALLPIPPDSYPQNEKTRFEHLERIRQHGLNLAKGKISAKVNWQTVSGYSCFTRHASTA